MFYSHFKFGVMHHYLSWKTLNRQVQQSNKKNHRQSKGALENMSVALIQSDEPIANSLSSREQLRSLETIQHKNYY